MPPARLFATDLDGTLLRSDLTVSEETRRALAAAGPAGVEVVFVTGRPPRWIPEVIAETRHSGMAIAANGAALIDLSAELVVHTAPIDPAVMLEVVARLRSIHPDFGFAVEQVRGSSAEPHPLGSASRFGHDPAYRPKWIPPQAPVVASIGALIEHPGTVKLLARGPEGMDHDADSLLAAAQEALLGLVEATHSNANDLLLEMSGLGTTKASALAELAAERGLGADAVVAVGDMPNDLPMLEWAGVGYAVADAHPAVREAVGPRRIIESNDDDAVAKLLRTLIEA